MHTLLVDGRKYIGITKYGHDPSIRWGFNGSSYRGYFRSAINKYGWDAFKHEILFENLSRKQACTKEQALIKLFNTTNHNFGFNMTFGGESNVPTPEAIHNISIGHIGIGTGPKVVIQYDELYEQYIVLNKTIEECATYFSCCSITVVRWLKRYNIVKDFQANRDAINKAHTRYIITSESLNYHYIVLDKTVYECAKYFSCSESNIYKKLDEFGIQRKEKELKCTEEELRYQYIALGKSQVECAKYFNCSETWIHHQRQIWNINREQN